MGKFKFLLLLVVGAAVAMAVNPGLRTKVLDKLFGAEAEFQYPEEPSAS